ncbi:hypothetical protein J1N35_043428 [Gossypium stocksii]|uniref:Uncharacterized protein n=1 Tax=Gossypium stocksii TaxID=47602 RepID=A0A9D3U7H8_9ROSI|nr:hypothetical protein J1N35_043428 [Gossypium stocksii]
MDIPILLKRKESQKLEEGQTHRGDEEEEATLENESEQELPREEDDYEAAFQPQYSTPKGPVIPSPTHHAPLTGWSFHERYGMGKGKAPMEIRHSFHFNDSNEY